MIKTTIHDASGYEEFPERKRLNIIKSEEVSMTKDVDYNYLVEQVQALNLDDVDFETAEYDSIDTKIEKQKVYFWIRVYLNEETEIEPGDDIEIKYINSGETLLSKFICYAKTGDTSIDLEGEVVTNYNAEDNKKVLCLMVDEEKINYDSEDILFIRKLFRIGRHYDHVLLRRSDLVLTNQRNQKELSYYDIEF